MINVLRWTTSNYLPKDFRIKEQSVLKSLGKIHYCFTQEDILPHYPVVLISQSQTDFSKIPQSILNSCVLIIHPNSGYDNIPIDFPIPVITGPEIRTCAVSEYILSCLFSWHSKIPFIPSNNPRWDFQRKFPRNLFSQKKGLLLGFGNIGKKIYQVLKTLNANVDVSDPPQGKAITFSPNYDYIIICMNLLKSNENYVGSYFFNKLPPHGCIINTSRGEVLDLDSLIPILKKNPQMHAFLDVFKTEPMDFKWIEELQNQHIFCSSHVAGVYNSIDDHIIDFIYDTLKEFLVDK